MLKYFFLARLQNKPLLIITPFKILLIFLTRYLIFTTLHKIKFIEKVAEDAQLRGGETRVAALLLNYCNTKTGRCFPSQNTIADRLKLSTRRVNTLIRNLRDHGHIKRIKKGNKNAGSNEYNLLLERFNEDKDIRKYTSRGEEIQRSKYRKYTSYETRNETSYETLVKDKSNLEGYVQFVKRGQRLTSISDDMVKEMYRRRLITAQEYKNW